MSPEVKALVESMADLTQAIREQTAAIAWLAKSNERMADEMAGGVDADQGDGEDETFLDGSRKQ